MLLPYPTRSRRAPRQGKVVALFVLLLPVLCGMLGLVIDSGLMMAAHRQAQNAADSAALAAAVRLLRGDGTATATTEANTFVQYNGLSNATVTVNIPPSQGPNAGNSNFVEVLVSTPVTTLFMGGLGIGQTTVGARAVAGLEPLGSGEGAVVLDPRAIPGLSVTGGGVLQVHGSLVVNSWGSGVDQYGQSVNWGYQTYAFATGNNSTVQAQYIQVHGGVDVVTNYQNITSGGPSPLYCRAGIVADPLRSLPIPSPTSVPAITNWTRNAAVSVGNGQKVTLNPGVYEDIQIGNGANVTFNPGVYVISPQKPNEGFGITGTCTVTGNGVMFYLTGSDYLDRSTGYYDTQDGAVDLDPVTNSLPAAPDPNIGSVNFALLKINASSGSISLTAINDTNSPFNGILFFQRRRNTQGPSIQGNAGGTSSFGGVMYAKWANFKVSGGGQYNAQWVVGSLSVSGQANMIINNPTRNFGRANQIYLVE